MAVLRNLVTSLLFRVAGHHNIARALRRCARHPGQAIALVMTSTSARPDRHLACGLASKSHGETMAS